MRKLILFFALFCAASCAWAGAVYDPVLGVMRWDFPSDATAAITAHAAATSGVHGAGASTLATVSQLPATDAAANVGSLRTLGTGALQALPGNTPIPSVTGLVTGPASATDSHLAVFDGATGKLLKDGGAVPSGSPSTAPVILTYASSVTPAVGDGKYRKCTVTGPLTLNAPTGGAEGDRWECWFTASGADRALTFNAAILVPSDSGFTSPKTMSNGKTYICLLKYNGAAWMLASFVGGY